MQISFTLGAMLKTTSAYSGNDGKIYVDIKNGYSFIKSQVETGDNLDKIISIVNNFLKSSYTKADLVLRNKEEKKEDDMQMKLMEIEGEY